MNRLCTGKEIPAIPRTLAWFRKEWGLQGRTPPAWVQSWIAANGMDLLGRDRNGMWWFYYQIQGAGFINAETREITYFS